MQDQPKAERTTLGRRKEAVQLQLDLHRIILDSETQTPAETADMRVDRQTWQTECHASHDVGSLPTHTRERDEFLQPGWNVTTESLDERLRHTDDVASLRLVEAGRPNDLFHLPDVRRGQRSGVGKPCEERRRHHVDPSIGRLSGEDGGSQQLERVRMIEFADRLGIRNGKPSHDRTGSPLGSSWCAHRGHVRACRDSLGPVTDFQVCDELAADRRHEVIALVERSTARIGHRPLSDHLWLDLLHGDRPRVGGVLALEADRLVGYAQLSPSAGGWVAGAVVDDNASETNSGLLSGILELAARRGGGEVHWWILGDDALSDTVALEAGMAPERAVHQMVVDLPLADTSSPTANIAVRPFRVGHDESAWLEVNNAAFAGHGEQGGWDVAMLGQREREPWFDPAGFLLHERNGRLAGFCWTKLHHDREPVVGEIYVIAVHPDFHGLGLGRALTIAGLDSIAKRGVHTGMLFVDTTNTAAIQLYRSLGFTVDRTDHAFVLTVHTGVTTSNKEDTK